jgi:hypothetical protein
MVPNLGRTFQNKQTYFENTYLLESIDKEIHAKAINGKYLKRYTSSIWKANKEVLKYKYPVI